MTYRLTRVRRGPEDTTDTWHSLSMRECGQWVAFTAWQLGLGRKKAAAHGLAAESTFLAGGGYLLPPYSFTVRKEC